MRPLTRAGDYLAAFLILVILSVALLLAGCASSPSSRSAVTAESFRVVDLKTCRLVVTPWPTSVYDGERSHQRYANWRPFGAPDTAKGRPEIVLPARADTGVDPFHCGPNR
jgi:hypothetical protein